MSKAYIPFTKDDIPLSLIVEIDSSNYEYELHYNETAGFYTLYVKNDEEIIYSTKLVFGNNALHAFNDKDIEKKIVPFDYYLTNTKITLDNFLEEVKLYVTD